MRHQSHSHGTRMPIDAGRQVAQLRHLLQLVEELAERTSDGGLGDALLDEGARISSGYGSGEPIVRKRFDALAAETATWSAIAVEALLEAGDARSPAAAARLADELKSALNALGRILAPAEVPAAAKAIP